MFNKLLGNLPFNPGLMHQVAFYGKRLKEEKSLRRTGFLFIALAFVVQLFAFTSPPQPSLAASTNDLVNGGFSSAAEAAGDCRTNVQGYGTILANYGITCDRVANASTLTINSHDFNNQLFSMGRLPYGIAGETPVNIAGTTYYVRYLWGWGDINYRALNVTATGGQTFFLLYGCGNLTAVGMPVPVQQPPHLTIQKTTTPSYPIANSVVAPGQILSYRIIFNNLGGPANHVTVSDPQPIHTTFVSAGATATFSSAHSTAYWIYVAMPSGALNYYTDVKFKVNANTTNGTKICNTATISATGVAVIASNSVCMTVKINAPPPKKTPPPPPVPCTQLVSSQNPFPCVVDTKTATNITQNITNANGTTAQAGDVIQYTLNAKNNGPTAVKQYTINEQLSDVLDYATVQNLNGGTLNDTTGMLSWPAVNIPAGQTVNKTFTVQVKNPLPQTPSPPSNPDQFNHQMINVYGNTITINLPTPIVQASAQAVQGLPNTGPGSSLLIAGLVAIAAGYFFARTRLLAKETDIIRTDIAVSGEF